MSLISRTRDTICSRGMINKGDTVLCAVSGGCDSMALLTVLSALSLELGFSLCAAHYDHAIRPESHKDAELVAAYCNTLGIKLFSERGDVLSCARGMTLEQAAREKRYDFLYRAASESGADKIAVAHHMDDQAETILMNIIRGSGSRGIAGMRYVRGMIIRPFLGFHRSEIEEFTEQLSIDIAHDETNDDVAYTRNRVRKNLLPLIRAEYNPAVDEALMRLAENASDDDEYIEEAARRELSARVKYSLEGHGISFLYGDTHPAVLFRMIKLCLFNAGEYDFNRFMLNNAMGAVRSGVKTDIGHRIFADRKGSIASVWRAGYEGECVKAEDGAVLKGLSARLTCGSLPEGCVLRTRRAGDVYISGGREKSLAELLKDTMPLWVRDRIAVVAQGNRVLYVQHAAPGDIEPLSGVSIAGGIKVV